MGSRMAKNLLKGGIDLTVFNRSKEIVQELEALGATAATTAPEAVKEADIVITMLSTPEVVEQVMLAEDGALHEMKTGAIWMDSSTVNPSFTIQAAGMANKHGVEYLDAPVAGTKPHAEHAELVFFVGGNAITVKAVEPLLNLMGNKVMHLGVVGKGAAFKMLVNAMLAQSMLVFAETLQLGIKMGIDQAFLLDVLPNLKVSAPFTKAKAEMIRADDYEVQFPLEWMQKDLHLAALTAYEHQQPAYLINLAKERYAEAVQAGLGRADFAAVYKIIAKTK